MKGAVYSYAEGISQKALFVSELSRPASASRDHIFDAPTGANCGWAFTILHSHDRMVLVLCAEEALREQKRQNGADASCRGGTPLACAS
jgi:hypothetical protein